MNNLNPQNIFPKEIQDIITNISIAQKVPEAVVATQILTSLGFAISNSYQVKINDNWIVRPNIWSISIADSGSNKSGLFSAILFPINQLKTDLDLYYNKQKEAFENMEKMEKLKTRKEKKEESVDLTFKEIKDITETQLYNSGNNICIQKPTKLTCTLENLTNAALLKALDVKHNNGRALLINYDEIGGFYAALQGKASDETDLNKMYDYSPYSKERQDETIISYIQDKTVSFIGTTQKEMLFNIFTRDRILNGNVFRYLFVEDNTTEIINHFKGLNAKKSEEFNQSFKEYLQIFGHFTEHYKQEPFKIELICTDEILNYLGEIRDNLDKTFINESIDIKIYKNIVGKINGYIIKFAIIINRLNAYYNTTEGNYELHREDFEKAEQLAKYYIQNILNVLEYIGNKTNKIANNDVEATFIDNLPMSFNTKEFVERYMLELHVSKPTSERRLKKFIQEGYFKSNSKGQYYKINS
jgi:hypothetical protein